MKRTLPANILSVTLLVVAATLSLTSVSLSRYPGNSTSTEIIWTLAGFATGLAVGGAIVRLRTHWSVARARKEDHDLIVR